MNKSDSDLQQNHRPLSGARAIPQGARPMRKTTTPTLRIAAVSLAALLAVSGPAGAAWNPATPGQAAAPSYADEAAPAPSSAAGSSQSISAAPLSATANPDAAGYDKKFKKGPWYPVGNAASMPVLNASAGAAPPYMSGVCVMVQGYAYSTGCIASMQALDSLYNYVSYQFTQVMQWLEKIYNYMAAGEGETGTGIIGIMGKEHDLDRKFLEEQLALNHARMQELMMKSSYADAVAKKIQSYRACDDIVANTMARSASGGAAGRGGGGSAAKGVTENKVAKAMAGGTLSEAGQAGRVYAEHAAASNGYCSYEDVNYYNSDGSVKGPRNAFGCSAPGEMPDGDARAQSVFAPAHDYTKPAVVAKQTLTFTTAQKNAADASIRNIVSAFSPPALPKEREATDAGKLYLAKTKVFNARVSSAVHSLAAMADRRTPASIGSGASGTSGGSFLFWSWGANDWKTVYARVFGLSSADVPAQLSEADSLRFEAYLRYYDDSSQSDSWYAKQVEGGSGDDLLKEQLRMGSVELMMLYNIHQRMEENNMIQAAILSHMINPVSKDELLRSAQVAGSRVSTP